ncbi:MAG: hypothetical protein IPO03_19030 [Bacteroidetes bacterium]|nr:hypothetical protein [Bacteroidota bacterium]
MYIGIGAALFTYEGYYLLHQTPKLDVLLLLSGAATMFVYLLIRVAAVSRIKEYAPEKRWDFFTRNLFLMQVLTVITFLITVVTYLMLPRSIQVLLFFPGIISLLYGIPIRFGKKHFRLRDIGVTKIFMIAFVWAFIGSFLPATNSELPIVSGDVILLFFAHYLFIFGITLPFDIKDLTIDAQHQVKTIPAIIGIQKSYNLSFLSLLLCTLLYVVMQQLTTSEQDFSLPLCITTLLSSWSIYLSRKKADNYLYFGLIDGMLIIQSLLVIVFALN